METDTTLDCPLMPDGEAREEAIREEIKRADWAVREPELEDENRELRRQLYAAREQCAKWKRRYDEEKSKKSYQSYPAYPAYKPEKEGAK